MKFAGGGASVHVCWKGDFTVQGKGKPGKPFRIKLTNPQLWSPDNPHLTEVDISLTTDANDSALNDTGSSYFAMRKISAAKDEHGVMRLMLNNKPVFQVGPLDQGWWPDGLLTPPSDEAMKYDLEVLKKLGFNMLRKHIKVEPARYYYHCDKLGLLVWQDMPSGGVPERGQLIPPNAKTDAKFTDDEKKHFRVELKAMIDHLRFFPCIVVWVPFNEGWGQHDTNDILKWVKEYDPSRLVNGPSGWADRGYGDMKDAHIYPGPGMFPVMSDRVSVLGEFGGLGLPLKGHLWKETDNWGYRTFKTTEELRQNYHQLMLRMHPLIGKGLSAAVYTQTTDVEVEVNGLMTYDREIIKLDVVETVKWHKALSRPVPVSRVPRVARPNFLREGRAEVLRCHLRQARGRLGEAGVRRREVGRSRRRVRHTGHAWRESSAPQWNTADIWVRPQLSSWKDAPHWRSDSPNAPRRGRGGLHQRRLGSEDNRLDVASYTDFFLPAEAA